MKVQVDFDLCESNALCEALAPETFELGDDDALQILDDRVTEDNVEHDRARGCVVPEGRDQHRRRLSG